ncbi:MAG: hypothetical protein Q9182_003091 [Xanthomendoza sp. 2 TL-2023]
MAEVETSLPPAMPSSGISESMSPQAISPQPISTELTTTDNTTTLIESANEPPAKKMKKIMRPKRRPARPQVDAGTFKSEPPPQTGTIFNIWYNKWSGGDREDKYLSKTAAPNRCDIERDSGYTRGDKIAGSYFCLFFARGLCPRGKECEYLHRLPGIHDLFNPNVDCFGRDKHSDYRDDMGGVGSFMRQNRTLYVGRIHVTDDIEEIVARHFAEWGQVERTRVLTARGVAFVTYSNEANSQFAKEAMAHQALDHNEVLNVRWATMDPNPLAQKREARKIEEQAAEAVRRALPAEFVREIEGRDPEARKRKRIEGGFGLEGYEAPDEIWYARSRQIENGDTALEGSGGDQPILLPDHAPAEAPQSAAGGGGILSASTLAALQSYAAQRNNDKMTRVAAPAPTSSGPLVGYGSDDDDSD